MNSRRLDLFDRLLMRSGSPDFIWPWIAGALSASVMLYWKLRFLYSQGYLHEMLGVSFGFSPPIIQRVKLDFIVLAALIVLNLLMLIPSLHTARKYRLTVGNYHYLFMSLLSLVVLVATVSQFIWIVRLLRLAGDHVDALSVIYPFLDIWIGTNIAVLLLSSAPHLDEMLSPKRSYGAAAFLFSVGFVLRMGHWWKGWLLSLILLVLSFLYLGLEFRLATANPTDALDPSGSEPKTPEHRD